MAESLAHPASIHTKPFRLVGSICYVTYRRDFIPGFIFLCFRKSLFNPLVIPTFMISSLEEAVTFKKGTCFLVFKRLAGVLDKQIQQLAWIAAAQINWHLAGGGIRFLFLPCACRLMTRRPVCFGCCLGYKSTSPCSRPVNSGHVHWLKAECRISCSRVTAIANDPGVVKGKDDRGLMWGINHCFGTSMFPLTY